LCRDIGQRSGRRVSCFLLADEGHSWEIDVVVRLVAVTGSSNLGYEYLFKRKSRARKKRRHEYRKQMVLP
jgi:phosphatidylserine/phosphatidylglycerophosphate/cardiolipin synthase-like enzyme